MKKLTIVINGKGGSGKDTVCEIVSRHYPTCNVSAITPVKELAAQCGWQGEKDMKARKFLADLKRLLADYNDYPTRYLIEQQRAFLADETQQIMFVHIREADQISAFLNGISGDKCTLLIRRPDLPAAYHNAADDNVEEYPYDFIYENRLPLESLEADFMAFFNQTVFCR